MIEQENKDYDKEEMKKIGTTELDAKFDSTPEFNTEEYNYVQENRFLNSSQTPLSTFSIDVDTASYSNLRRYLTTGQLPPVDAVRIEEMINYFSYELPEPNGEEPFSISTEIAKCPWNSKHYLAMIGLQAKKINANELPASNLIFLLDVSGSMNDEMKLPLLKKSFNLLVEQLSARDRVSIVVYAGASGVVLDGAEGNETEKILSAINNLNAGGSTAGAEGIELAYKLANEYYIEGGNNRVILATDGDFNVGVSSEGELSRLIEKKRNEGIFLSVLGFGTGNIKDNKMEALADKGNGNYAYIDSLMEAKKVLVTEMGGTLFTVAKDVKIQVEFNPSKVSEYRLVGYDNRLLRNEDFNDDTKDAGEIGAGHNVIAFYELVPVGSIGSTNTEELKYQKVESTNEWHNEWMEVRLRYKEPEGLLSKKLVVPVTDENAKSRPSIDFRFAASVAELGLLLKNSEFKADASYENLISEAENSLGNDKEGYRKQFLELVEMAKYLYKE